MGSLSYLDPLKRIARRKIDRPIGAHPEDVFITVEIDDDAYRRFTTGTLLVFKQGLISKRGVHLIEYKGGLVLPVSIKALPNGRIRMTSLHPDVKSGDFAVGELDIIGRLIEVYPPVEEETRYILWQDDYEVVVRRKRRAGNF